MLYLADNMFGVIDNNINKMLSYQYTITGNWHDPKIEKVRALQEDKQVNTSGTEPALDKQAKVSDPALRAHP